MHQGQDARGWLVAPAVLILGVLFVYPVSALLLLSVTSPAPGLQNFATLVEAPVYLRALWNTVVISGSVTLLCVLLGYPIAYTMANASPRLGGCSSSPCSSLSGRASWCAPSPGWSCCRNGD